MFPVGDWVRNVCAWTKCTPASALSLLKGSHAGSADFDSLDRLDEHADRIITGFDIIDLTLRELPHLHSGTLASWADLRSRQHSIVPGNSDREAAMRERVPVEHRSEFEEGLREARAAYGLHDEDVRITYLWPLGLLRRAIFAAAGHLIDSGRLFQSDHIFQTTPLELDNLLAGSAEPGGGELAQRAEQFAAWKDRACRNHSATENLSASMDCRYHARASTRRSCFTSGRWKASCLKTQQNRHGH